MTQRPFDQTLAQTLKALRPAPDNRDAWSHEGRAYMGGVQLGSVTDQFGLAQIYNPEGSAKLLALDHYVIGSNANGHTGGLIERMNRSGTDGDITPMHPVRRDSVARIQALSLGTAPALTHMILRNTANRYNPVVLSSPILLPPGYGFTCYTGTVTTTIALMGQWRELDL